MKNIFKLFLGFTIMLSLSITSYAYTVQATDNLPQPQYIELQLVDEEGRSIGSIGLTGNSKKGMVTVDAFGFTSSISSIGGDVEIIVGSNPKEHSFEFFTAGLYAKSETWTYTGWSSATLKNAYYIEKGKKYPLSDKTIYAK